jgi:hypothetical protein
VKERASQAFPQPGVVGRIEHYEIGPAENGYPAVFSAVQYVDKKKNFGKAHKIRPESASALLKVIPLCTPESLAFQDEHGNTFLHYLARLESEKVSACIAATLNSGARMDVRNRFGETPRDFAESGSPGWEVLDIFELRKKWERTCQPRTRPSRCARPVAGFE